MIALRGGGGGGGLQKKLKEKKKKKKRKFQSRKISKEKISVYCLYLKI